MKKTFVFVVLLLSLFAYKVNATPNSGTLPENSVKINFNSNGTYNSIEGDGWMVDEHHDHDNLMVDEHHDGLMLTKDEVVIHLMHYVFNDDGEIIGFHWMIEGATAILWVKHGTTTEIYGEGTEGDFLTSDNKQVSNVVFLIEIIIDDEEEEEVDEEEELDDEEEELDDEEEELDDEEEELDDEEEELDDEVLGDEEENVDEEEQVEEDDEVLGEEEESLPDTSDATAGLGLLSGLFGFMLLFATKKKN